ncbi:class I SAM-dependent methyltransferase [Bartonella sp. HY329]|uniref:rhamnosyltransferase WsaF family glycosyltransferase n=1 Tax=unclassified Bartonella TaxID=2645622 RepID=UPI0021C88888|nr:MULTISPECIES: class I SAM-dependent methyltransferase [unclassified Bartonella]UXM96066.1 class I SAM-dependent methyltransferase [Bartonella sp. HY329]UXN10390.1 class I SAM-dependent methyltransferase [Bartonella sp. HY328]
MVIKKNFSDSMLSFLIPSFWPFKPTIEQYKHSAWAGHVPFLMCLTALHKPALFVELGTHRGLSFNAFCYAAERLEYGAKAVAVDTWLGDEQAAFYDNSIFEGVQKDLVIYDHFATLKRMTFEEAVDDFENGSIDLLHIDGFHTYEAVKKDFETYISKMSNRGVIIFHDTNVFEADFGVWRFWEEVSKNYPHFNFMHGHGLGVLYVGQNQDEPIIDILKNLNEDQDLRNFYKVYFQKTAEFIKKINTSVEISQHIKLENLYYEAVKEKDLTLDKIASLEKQYTDSKKNNEEMIVADKAIVAKYETLAQTYDALVSEFNTLQFYNTELKSKNENLTLSNYNLINQVVGEANSIINNALKLMQSRNWLLKRYLTFWKYIPRDLSRKLRGKPAPKKNIPIKNVALLDVNNYLNFNAPIANEQIKQNVEKNIITEPATNKHLVGIKHITAHICSYPRINLTKNISKIEGDHRFNIVFTGFQKNSFFGGKATALRLALEYVIKHKIPLRILACAEMDIDVFNVFLKHNNLSKAIKVEFLFLEENSNLPIDEKDVFLCTMWSNLKMLKEAGVPNKIFYIMQEVETFFYDHGDLHLNAYLSLTDENIYPIVNTKLLYDYLVNAGYDNVKNQGIYFEPAFSELLQPSKKSFLPNKRIKKLFFFARPSHQRNLFYFCFNVLNEAFNRGILSPEEWVIYTAGDSKDFGIEFDNKNVTIVNNGVMDWDGYYELMSEIDLCFSVIYTPHPSYPPFDAACSGSVVLTNQAYNKKDLSNYSKNIICANLTLDHMLAGLKDAIKLVNDVETRKENFKNNKINRDWVDALSNSVDFLEKNIKEEI